MTHCPSITWRLDVSLLTGDLTWHSNTHYVLMTHVDDLTCNIYYVLMTWCLLTHHVLMTLTYDTLLYNNSLPIHDLTSWRLTAHQWRLDIQKVTTCWWLMLMTWRLTFTVYVTWCPLTHYVLMTLTSSTHSE